MSQWGNKDQANNAPKWKSIATGSPTPNRGNTVYANTTVGAFIAGESLGVFGVDVVESATVQPKSIAPGWVLTRKGTGGLTAITFTSNTTTVGYVNTDVVVVASPVAGSNASASITTNATGGSVTLKITNPGSGFTVVNATPNVAITNATGGTATGNSTVTPISATIGGHAGRIFREPLVIVKGMANNAASGGGSTTP